MSITLPLKQVKHLAFSIFILFLLMIFIPWGKMMCLGIAAIFAIYSARSAMVAFGLVFMVNIANPAILDSSTTSVTFLGWIIMILAGLRIMITNLNSSRSISSQSLCLLCFSCIVIALTFISSDYPVISIFKIVVFAFMSISIFAGSNYLVKQGINLFPYLMAFWATIIIGSLPFLIIPNIGYFRDGLGFQGLTNQPQALAIVLTPAIAWAGSYFFLHGKNSDMLVWIIFIVGLIEIFLTRGRTAVLALAMGWSVAILLAFIGNKRWLNEIFRANITVKVLVLLMPLFMLTVLYAQQIETLTTQFIFKNISDVSLSESFSSSRGTIQTEQIRNFTENIWTGIGFGTSRSDIHPFQPTFEPMTGLPLSASTEKANIVVALLEETGLIGTMMFIPFFVILISKLKRNADLAAGSAAFAVIASNFGEMVFFSMGGVGLYQFLILGMFSAGMVSSNQVFSKNRHRKTIPFILNTK